MNKTLEQRVEELEIIVKNLWEMAEKKERFQQD